MKNLYLLFAVFFLVLQSSPGFTQRIKTKGRCRIAGGFCTQRCHRHHPWLGICSPTVNCCKSLRLWKKPAFERKMVNGHDSRHSTVETVTGRTFVRK
nr:beta-defensin 9-like [Pelodiscus sinensis]|eukprot:XP_025042692.1 beta-defensin 9-like [Pelodiscus sinensis]